MDELTFQDGIRYLDNALDMSIWTTNRSWLWQMAQAAYRRRLPIQNPTRRARVRQFLTGIRTGKVAL